MKQQIHKINKRIFDLAVASVLMLLCLPLLIIIALAIKIDSGGTILFKQVRIGRYGVPFVMYKFRTMSMANVGLQITVINDKRITAVGKWLRASKLDELPQLFNVIIGNMSLVGPRPEVARYVAYYPHELKVIVQRVLPGVTDWASIKMFDESALLAKAENPEQIYIDKILPYKLQYAVQYALRNNLMIDCYIIIMTILKVVRLVQ